MKRVVILPGAARDLRKHRAESMRLLGKINDYARDPAALTNNVKALKGSPALRLRVGSFRVIFEETIDEVIVTKIAPRGSAYD